MDERSRCAAQLKEMEEFHEMRSSQRVGAVGRMTSGRICDVTVAVIVTGVYSLSSLSLELKVFFVQYLFLIDRLSLEGSQFHPFVLLLRVTCKVKIMVEH